MALRPVSARTYMRSHEEPAQAGDLARHTQALQSLVSAAWSQHY